MSVHPAGTPTRTGEKRRMQPKPGSKTQQRKANLSAHRTGTSKHR